MADADPALEIDIRIEAAGWRAMTIPAPDHAERAVRAALDYTNAGGSTMELSLVLTDDAAIAALNEQWRGKAGPTNVLSFPGDAPAEDGGAGRPGSMPGDAPVLLGDIVIAFETLIAEAEAAGISPTDHLCHLCVHGVLHLLGYDHENDEDAAEMESCEIEILGTLGVPDPYAAADLRLERAVK